MQLVVNGRLHEVDVDPETPLLWVLRDHLSLTGAKYGCGIGQCGSCTVQVNGAAVRSCTVPVAGLDGAQIRTIEGLGAKGLHSVQQAWIDEQVPQCGYCQPGMIMATVALLEKDPAPSDEVIDANITNLCRCGTYIRIRRAIHRAARSLAEDVASFPDDLDHGHGQDHDQSQDENQNQDRGHSDA